jgi:hypothetical protein
MNRAAFAFVVFSLPALPAFLAPPALPAQQEPSFRAISSELVVLPVIVQDKQGRSNSSPTKTRP